MFQIRVALRRAVQGGSALFGGTRLAGAAPVGTATYQPRAAEGTVLHRVVRENLETFLREVADLDVLACPRCGGRMAVIATIEAGEVMRTILDHLGLPTEPPSPLPARPPPVARDLFPDTPA